MFVSFINKFFGSNEKEINKLKPIVEKINNWEDDIKKLTDKEIKNKAEEFKKRIKNGSSLNKILPEAFAVVREAAWRVMKERPYDVQLMGGIVLHQGKIAEMKTGEGKTLTSALAIYLNALSGKGVHVVTVNDYLAKRDCNWMGAVFNFLGISTACIIHDNSYIYKPQKIDGNEVSVEMENLQTISRKEAYAADVTYGTNNEFGFDYLRDNMVQDSSQMVQRKLNYAIVDEVDSILIDEARTPLIISAPDTESTKMYQQFAALVPRLKKGEDFEVDEKMKAVTTTDKGISKLEKWLNVGNIYESGKMSYVHHLEQALKAQFIFQRDRDYVVKDGEIIIVDDFTGRLMAGRRYSEGLHQAIEAKEGVKVQKESRTLATITFQNYFRIYKKLAGMTGTAVTSAEEFSKVYEIDVIEIPTNKPLIRKDISDVVYKSEKGKFRAIVEKIKAIHATGQPVLVGTIAIEKSEYLSALLQRSGIKHEVLNAKHHEKEASIIANAGQRNAVTIATNMAGRGTDIKLGKGVKEVGGLFILGTERHEARRIDNQLRGRAGRQGDPGTSQFFVSLEDELMRRFGGDKLIKMMDTLRLPEDQPIQNKIISKTIENAQSKIEGFNFDIRKHVLDYDDVINKQREVIYKQRKEVLKAKETKNIILEYISEEIEKTVAAHYLSEKETWNVQEIYKSLKSNIDLSQITLTKLDEIKGDKVKNQAEKNGAMIEYLMGLAKEAYNKKRQALGLDNANSIEKAIILQTVDTMWMNHLDEIDYLREGIGLRGYGQRDPLVEYKKEAFLLFSHLLNNIRSTIVHTIFKINVDIVPIEEKKQLSEEEFNYQGGGEIQQFSTAPKENSANNERTKEEKPKKKQQPIVNKEKIGRNDPCPCGSGKKYKKCCGK